MRCFIAIDLPINVKTIIFHESKKLQTNFKILQQIDLQPFDKDHAMVIAKFHANN